MHRYNSREPVNAYVEILSTVLDSLPRRTLADILPPPANN
jgi:hypothetical protein